MQPEPPSSPGTGGTVRRYADAWTRADLAALLDCYADDVTLHYGGTSPFAGSHHGRARVVEVLAETAVRGARRLVAIDEVHDTGPTGAIFAREAFDVDGRTVTVARALRYRVVDDRIVECWLYDHDQHLVDAAWRDPDAGGDGTHGRAPAPASGG